MATTMIRRRMRRPKTATDPSIGQRVQLLRTRRKMLQEELAYEVGVSVGVMSRFEQGHQSLSFERMMRIAITLHVSLDCLAGLAPETPLPE